MAITITNTGADAFISDGSQNPSFNKNFIAGLTKATAINNPITGGLDSVLVLDNTNRSIVMAYSDITDINGSTPITLGLTDAQEVATYLNNNFFKFGETGITSVTTASPLTGDGVGNPVTFAAGLVAGQLWFWNGAAWVLASITTSGVIEGNGTAANPIKVTDGVTNGQFRYWNGSAWVLTNVPTKSGQIMIWNGTVWQMVDAPSYNLLARRSVQSFTFEGGFVISGGPPNGNILSGTTLQRNSPNVSLLSPGEAGRRAIIQNIGAAGNWIKLYTTATAGQVIRISNTSDKNYYFRITAKYPNAAFPGSFRCGIFANPATTITGGFGFEITSGGVRAFVNTASTYYYGANFATVNNVWYDMECLYTYTGGSMQCQLYVDGVLVSTATHAVAAFTHDCSIGISNATGAATGIIHNDLLEYSIY